MSKLNLIFKQSNSTAVKKLGGWKSPAIVEGYIDDNLNLTNITILRPARDWEILNFRLLTNTTKTTRIY
jgi:hypothetical protein